LAIVGMGTAVPPDRVSREEAIEAAKKLTNCDADKAASLTVLYNHTDIAGRHMIIGREVLSDVLRGTRQSGSPFVPRGPEDRGPDTAQRMRVYEREVLPLARQACEAALRQARVKAATISHLV